MTSSRFTGFSRVTAAVLCFVTAIVVGGCGGGASNGANHASASLGTQIYGTLPPVGTPVKGGTINVGQLNGQTPTYIFPIAPGAQTSTATISLLTELFMPLYTGPKGAVPTVDYRLSAANPPQFSDGNLTVRIPLKPGLKWSNGDPLDAKDVVFWFDLLKAAVKESAANWGQYTPGLMPDNVKSISTQGTNTVVMHLTRPFNPGFFLNNNLQDTNNVFPLPSRAWNIAAPGGPHLDYTNPANAKKIYDFLSKAGGSVATFASNPLWKVNSGPFQLKSFSPANSSYVLTPNPSYGGTPKSMTSQVSFQTYTGITAELNALKSGSLDVGGFSATELGQVATLKRQGIAVFGGPGWGWFGGQINFKNTTNHFDKVIAQLYVRQAITHLIDQPAIVRAVYKGAAVAAYGPTPSAPSSPYAPASATTPPYKFDPAAAVSLLKAHGWNVVPNGTTTCAKPGTGPNQCGAGIPAGTPISFVWANQPESVSPTGALESEVIASQAKKSAGINIKLLTKTYNFLTANYNDANPSAAKYTNDWGVNNYGGLFTNFYPTAAGTWNAGGGFNTGAYTNPQADKLIDASVHGGDPNAVKAEADFFARNPPVFFLPDQDTLAAVNTKRVGGQPDGWAALTQQQSYPQFWYRVK